MLSVVECTAGSVLDPLLGRMVYGSYYDKYRECLESKNPPNLKYTAEYLGWNRRYDYALVEEEAIDSDISDKYAPQVEAQWDEVLRKMDIARTAVEDFHSIGSGYDE